MLKFIKLFSVALICLLPFQNCSRSILSAPSNNESFVQFNSVNGSRNFTDEVFVGYQGWFSTPDDGFMSSWFHWEGHGRSHVDLLPDVSIYPQSILKAAPFNNGYKLFSSASPDVVDVHTELIAKAGIDGFALQRFVTRDLEDRDGRMFRQKNQVAKLVRQSAEKWGTKFYIMYDITGNARKWAEAIKNDFELTLKDQMRLLDSPNYARQKGKPVVCIWGAGAGDRPGTAAEAADLIQWFKDEHGVYVVGGVATGWRDSAHDSKPGWEETYLKYDSIESWSIGHYIDEAGIESFYKNVVDKDLQYVKEKNAERNLSINYKTVIWAGFSWYNMNRGDGVSVLNAIPRKGGTFLWKQAQEAAARGIKSYVAMFDEYDEGTAIAPAVNTKSLIPAGTTFLTLDADGIQMTSDFYVRLTAEITRNLRSGISNPTFTTRYSGPAIALEKRLDPVVPVPAPTPAPAPTPLPLPVPAPAPLPVPAPAPLPLPAPVPVPVVPETKSFKAGSLILNTWQKVVTASMELVMQADGNLVIYKSGKPIWASNTGQSGDWCQNKCVAKFQGDGNLVLYKDNVPFWSTQTHGAGDYSKTLIFGVSTRYLEIKSGAGQSVWKSN